MAFLSGLLSAPAVKAEFTIRFGIKIELITDERFAVTLCITEPGNKKASSKLAVEVPSTMTVVLGVPLIPKTLKPSVAEPPSLAAGRGAKLNKEPSCTVKLSATPSLLLSATTIIPASVGAEISLPVRPLSTLLTNAPKKPKRLVSSALSPITTYPVSPPASIELT